jgi:tRNA1(Val) A37 N6-methylase TrmN6
MCAGRGSRMIACAAMNVDYYGVDPCETSFEGFNKLRKFAEYCGATNKSVLIKAGFETNWPEDNLPEFDMMFTSPPYFNLEIYEDNPNQSTNKFPNLNDWVNNFIKVSLEKSLRLVKNNGLVILNIDNPSYLKVNYVDPIIKIELENGKYIGMKKFNTNKRIFTAHIWQKK